MDGKVWRAYKAHRASLKRWTDGKIACVSYKGDGTLCILYESGRCFKYTYSRLSGWYWYE